MATSISNYRLENNRKYHTYRDGSYWAPHDKEAVRLDTIAHHIFLLTLNDRLFLAPLSNPKKVLDVGTGNGVWAQNFADRYPEADVIGTDLAPVQEETQTPPNLRFEIDDCCSAWVYPPDHFDYIHVRLLYGSIGDWDDFYRECYEHLVPGGYLEHADTSPALKSDDGSLSSESPLGYGGAMAFRCGELAGRSFDLLAHMKRRIAKAGFVDIVEETFKWPIGDWPADQKLKEIGRWNATHWDLGIEAWSIRSLTQLCGWNVEQVKKYNDGIRAQIQARSSHAYQPVGSCPKAICLGRQFDCHWCRKHQPRRKQLSGIPKVLSQAMENQDWLDCFRVEFVSEINDHLTSSNSDGIRSSVQRIGSELVQTTMCPHTFV